jgi:nucleoside-triphosphatase
MARTLFLTGRPGVGKTTVIKAVARALGEQADGFYTEEIRESGRRRGFRLVGLRGERGVLAHVKFKGYGRPTVGQYGVDVPTLDQIGATAIERAASQRLVVIIDEIGKMELFSETFKSAVLTTLDGQSPVIATVMAGPHPWVDDLRARPGVTLWELTLENRDEMRLRVLNWLRRESCA